MLDGNIETNSSIAAQLYYWSYLLLFLWGFYSF